MDSSIHFDAMVSYTRILGFSTGSQFVPKFIHACCNYKRDEWTPDLIYCCAIRILPCGNEFRHKLASGRETQNPRIVMDNSYPFWCNEFIPSWIVLIHFDAMISYCDQALSQVFHPKSTLMKWNCDPSHEFIASKWTTAIPYLSSSFIVMEYR